MEDPIAAIATAPGEGGIAIIRISGTGSREMAMPRFVPAGSQTLLHSVPPRQMVYGTIVDDTGNPLDQILWVWFEAPRSYTGEEVVELQCHGGYLVAQRILQEMLSLGARLAVPGEFTQRAFLNGRIDLAQAEGVLGLIRARNDEALRAAHRSLEGAWARMLLPLRNELLDLLALVQATLDFPEEELPFLNREDLARRLDALENSLHQNRLRARSGALLATGWRVALVGRPNVGKSSVLNALLQQAKAIVTALPGTTRDVVEDVMTYRGVPFRLLDTAGIRDALDPAERVGVDRAKRVAEEADFRLWVLDASEPLQQEDFVLGKALGEDPERLLVVRNKGDLPSLWSEEDLMVALPFVVSIVTVSALREEGMEELKERLWHVAVGEDRLEDAIHASTRQYEELRRAEQAVVQGKSAVALGHGEDIVALELQEALSSLERVLGWRWDGTLLETVFSRFCIGK